MSMQSGNPIVDEVGKINITGNVIPQAWYQSIVRENGKPYLAAIVILSDIVYWYRPIENRDECSGRVVSVRKRFEKDLLQRSYTQLAEMFGLSKTEATNAVIHLEHLGVIKRVFRTVEVNGTRMSNMLFISLNPQRLKEITFGIDAPEAAGETHEIVSEPPAPAKKPKPAVAPEPAKIKYAEFVELSEDEYAKLVEAYGEAAARKMIEKLDNYKGSSGKKYKSDYRAILTWVVKSVTEEAGKQGGAFNGGPAPSNFKPSDGFRN